MKNRAFSKSVAVSTYARILYNGHTKGSELLNGNDLLRGPVQKQSVEDWNNNPKLIRLIAS